VFHPAKASFEFRKGPLFSNIVLIDEINRAPAKTQSALFEVMEERQITVDGTTYELAKPFMVLATQNPIEHEGTYRLPEAQLDRFIFKVLVKYPTVQEEILILEGHHQRKESNPAAINVSEILNAKKIEQLRNQIRLVHVEKKLMDYIAALVTQTRNDKSLYLGASPRASVSLLNASKALAALRNRDFITPEDVQELAYPVMRHRIMLTPEKEMEGITADDVIKQIVQRVEVPR
jgi:MoxR-like ATPase